MIGKLTPNEMSIARIGPNIDPCWAKDIPILIAIILTVPWNKESPIPDNGPINTVFTEVIILGSKTSGFSAYSSSIAAVKPNTNAPNCGVILKNSNETLYLSFFFSSSFGSGYKRSKVLEIPHINAVFICLS